LHETDGEAAGDPLRAALRELGLDSPGGLAARFVADGSRVPRVERPLSDDDPWIAFRSKPTGARVLSWLPSNLDRTLARASAAPAAWGPAPGSDGERLSGGVRALHRARVEHARSELEQLLGRATLETPAQALAPALEPLRRATADPEIAAFLEEVEFLLRLRKGVLWLQTPGGRARDGAAVEELVRAAELRPERADVHAYLAAALKRAGAADGARAAARRAEELCPGIAETPEGKRALGWGVAEEWWSGESR